MRALVLALAVLPFCAGVAFAGSMPVLPDLPPLPEGASSLGAGGFYAGVLVGGGVGGDVEGGPEASIVLGNTMQAADLLLGAELMASADTHGGGAVEANLRLILPASDSFAVFGIAGLGYDFDQDGFGVLGLGAEVDIGNDWLVRADYRANLDFSGEAEKHRVLTGLVKRF